MHIKIIIVFWRNKAQTLALIEAIYKWQTISFELVLVQNQCNEDAFAALNQKKLHKIIVPENKGFGGGVNLGVQLQTNQATNFTLLLNTDAFIEEAELEKLLHFFIKQKNTFSLAPKLIESNGTESKTYIGGRNIAKQVNTRILQNTSTTNKNYVEVDYNVGAVFLINNQLIDEVGYIDEAYFFSGEIADWCYRAQQKGLKNICYLDAFATHTIGDSKLRNTLYKYYNFRNRFVFIRKHKEFKTEQNKWYVRLFKELIYGLLTFNFTTIKTMFITITDVLTKSTGNKNHHFL